MTQENRRHRRRRNRRAPVSRRRVRRGNVPPRLARRADDGCARAPLRRRLSRRAHRGCCRPPRSTRNPINAIPAALKIWRGINEAKTRFTRTAARARSRASAAIRRFPRLMAARAHKIPILIHEQNSVLGRVNRTMATQRGHRRLRLRAARSPAGQARAIAQARRRQSGAPADPRRARARRIRKRRPGGAAQHSHHRRQPGRAPVRRSDPGGDRAAAASDLRARLDVVHQVREEQVGGGARRLRSRQASTPRSRRSSPTWAQRLAAAHLVIARAGASSVTELQVAGRPADPDPVRRRRRRSPDRQRRRAYRGRRRRPVHRSRVRAGLAANCCATAFRPARACRPRRRRPRRRQAGSGESAGGFGGGGGGVR